MTISASHPTRANNKRTRLWIVTEGLAGTENQCLGIADALGIAPVIKRISLRQPWKTLSPYLHLECPLTFIPSLSGPWPDLLLTAGRKSIAAARYISKQSGGHTICVHAQDPRCDSAFFDLVAVPMHDPLRGDNVIVTAAAANRITPEIIETKRSQFNFLQILDKPRISVMIGGNSKAYNISMSDAEFIINNLLHLEGSLMVTCSRRTPEPIRAYMEEKLTQAGHYFWNGKGENPYLGLLGWADYILVTADSVSMISESCTTGKPVYMIPLNGGSKRINLFHKNLIDLGVLRLFKNTLETFTYEPLNDAKLVADAIKSRFPSLRIPMDD